MIFVPHIGREYFVFVFGYFLFLLALFTNFHRRSCLGQSSRHSGKGNLSGGGLASCQEDKVLLDVGKVEFVLRAKEEFACSCVSILPYNFSIFDNSKADHILLHNSIYYSKMGAF